MKSETVTINRYEVGDVILITPECFRLLSKRSSIGRAERCVVYNVTQRTDRLFTYKVFAQNGKTFSLTPAEQGNEKYIGHIDMSLMFEDGDYE